MPRRAHAELETNPYARRMAILEIVYSASGPIRSGELIARFNIESNLLAYDLQRLEELGLIERSFGWVRKRSLEVSRLFPDSDFTSRLQHEAEAKQQIAEYVVDKLIPPGAQVAFDAGTTPYFVAKALVEKRKSTSIWTNNIPLFLYVVSHSEMPCNLVGGELDRAQAALTGESAAYQVAEMRFDLAILAPKGALLVDPHKVPEGSWSLVTPLPFLNEWPKDEIKAVLILFHDDPKQLAYKRTIAANANRIIIPLVRNKFCAVGFPFLYVFLLESTKAPIGAVHTRGAIPVRTIQNPETLSSYALISRLLNSTEPQVRHAVVEALTDLADFSAIELLLPLLQDKEEAVRKAVEKALVKLLPRKATAADLRRADEVVVVTDASLEELRSRCPDAEESLALGRREGFLVLLNVR